MAQSINTFIGAKIRIEKSSRFEVLAGFTSLFRDTGKGYKHVKALRQTFEGFAGPFYEMYLRRLEEAHSERGVHRA